MKKKDALKLYLITDRKSMTTKDFFETIVKAVSGGVTMVQLREKDISTREYVELAIRLKRILLPLGVPLIINDRVDVACAADADGVHLGQSDMSSYMARKLMGKDKIIGISVENIRQVALSNLEPVDYIATSPVFESTTKTDTGTPFGLDGLKIAVHKSKRPIVAIGGINTENVAQIMNTEVYGIAVSSAIMKAVDPELAAKNLKAIIAPEIIPTWSKLTWKELNPIFLEIIRHPFIQELAKGILDVEKFKRYMAQDEVYIHDYGTKMLTLANKMENPGEKEMFTQFAQAGIESEQAMHKLLVERLGVEGNAVPSEVTNNYLQYIDFTLVMGSKELALAAMLPCMWIYNKVGLYIRKIAHMEENPYREWIETYGTPEFTEGVNAVLELIDRWAGEASEEVRQQMKEACIKAARFEYEFWNYGYNG